MHLHVGKVLIVIRKKKAYNETNNESLRRPVTMKKLILFDGECHFCDSSVQFIMKRDQHVQFSFVSLQSDIGQKLLAEYQLADNLDSMVLIEEGKAFIKSTAALRIAKHLDGLWKWGYIFILVPSFIRDIFYKIIAKNRYKWFGRKESCEIPSPEVRKRFLT